MRNWNVGLSNGVVVALAALLAAPAVVSAEIYAWRTEDGVFAYTDDQEKIPSRYADDAVSVDSGLAGYSRLTREDTAAARAVSSRMEKRLDYLRSVNAQPVAPPRAQGGPGGQATISVATGSANAPVLDIPVGAGVESAPIVVEPVVSKRSGKIRTRRTTLVKQGDRTVAVIKGRPHHFNVNDDIYDEDDLVEQR